MQLVIARNPDPASTLPYLIRVPLGPAGRVLRTSGTWPREKALYCHPVPTQEWPADPDVVEAVALRSCVRRGAAIDLVLDRARENRSQIVYTTAHGRDVVFWQSPKTRKQARPQVRTPTARAAGLADLTIVVDTRERYPYRFTKQQVSVQRRALPVGDYGVTLDGEVVAVVERKSLADLVTSLRDGSLRYRLGELASVPRAAVVVEDRWSQVFALEHARPAQVADELAELQVRWPGVPTVFCENRPLAQEWTYRYLAAAWTWALGEDAARARIGPDMSYPAADPAADPAAELVAEPPAEVAAHSAAQATAEPAQVRRWARDQGLTVPERGRLPGAVRQAFLDAHR